MTSYLSFNFTVSCLHSRSSNTQVELLFFFSAYTGFTARFLVIFSNSLNVLLMRWVGVNSAPRSARPRDALAKMGTRTFSGDARRLIVGLNSLKKKSWKNHWLLSNTLRLARPSCLSSAVRKSCRTLRFCSFSVNCGAPAPGCVDSPQGVCFNPLPGHPRTLFPGRFLGLRKKRLVQGMMISAFRFRLSSPRCAAAPRGNRNSFSL